MKTKLVLLFTALASLTSYSIAGPSDSIAIASAHGNQQVRQNAVSGTSNDSSAAVKWVPSPNGKGGFVARAERDASTASIALTKSPKTQACSGSACCAKN
jgi:hypothetical protein